MRFAPGATPAMLAVAVFFCSSAVTGVGSAEEGPRGAFSGRLTVVDPDGDCEVLLKSDRLTIVVPAKNHNLHPVRGMNAPRVLKRVSGDFDVQVKVSGEFQPGRVSTKPLGQGRPFNGAGLLLWDDEENYLRIERNAYWVDDKLYSYPPLIEYWRDRADSGYNSPPTAEPYFQGNSTWLRARRHGHELTISISHDGQKWGEVKTFELDMGDELSVGVAAVNSSDKPFRVNFSEFTITAP